MILWIVEDQRKEANAVVKAVNSAFPNTFDIYVNDDINWPADRTLPVLKTPPGLPFSGTRMSSSSAHLPDIVVLDLLLADEEGIPGSLFYERLRAEERSAHKRRSQILIYSQYRGMIFTELFVKRCYETDNHVDGVNLKSPGLLVEKLQESIIKVRTEE